MYIVSALIESGLKNRLLLLPSSRPPCFSTYVEAQPCQAWEGAFFFHNFQVYPSFYSIIWLPMLYLPYNSPVMFEIKVCFCCIIWLVNTVRSGLDRNRLSCRENLVKVKWLPASDIGYDDGVPYHHTLFILNPRCLFFCIQPLVYPRIWHGFK